MSLKGSLESINLADIMQLVSNSRQSGRFELTKDENNKGFIVLKRGEIIHAEVDNFIGEDAVFTLISWGKGEFVFKEGHFEAKTTITRSITSLLMEAARRIDPPGDREHLAVVLRRQPGGEQRPASARRLDHQNAERDND